MTKARTPFRQADVSRDAPLRLDIAAGLAFPGGAVSTATLRREAERGNLEISRIGKAHFTTLAAIDRMVEKCRVPPKAPISTCGGAPGANPLGSSETAALKSAQAALQTTVAALKKGSPPTLPKSTGQTSATVIRAEFPSPTSLPSTPKNESR